METVSPVSYHKTSFLSDSAWIWVEWPNFLCHQWVHILAFFRICCFSILQEDELHLSLYYHSSCSVSKLSTFPASSFLKFFFDRVWWGHCLFICKIENKLYTFSKLSSPAGWIHFFHQGFTHAQYFHKWVDTILELESFACCVRYMMNHLIQNMWKWCHFMPYDEKMNLTSSCI